MFYCKKCAENNGYPESMRMSFGNCEICSTNGDCYDVPSSHLPSPNRIDSKFYIASKHNVKVEIIKVKNECNIKWVDKDSSITLNMDERLFDALKNEILKNK